MGPPITPEPSQPEQQGHKLSTEGFSRGSQMRASLSEVPESQKSPARTRGTFGFYSLSRKLGFQLNSVGTMVLE